MAAEPRYPVPPEVLQRFAELGREGSTLAVLRHARIAERMGLSGTDHKALDLASRADGPLTAGRIAQLTGLSTGAVTGVIDRLERAGFVRRVRDTQDRRKVLVEILPMDEERYAPLFSSALDVVEQVLERFSPEERDVVERFEREVQRLMRNDILDESKGT
ncbi:MarR family transcriptional regulator [Amycolatopsis acidiphila]|uniref:MarR family transcriptional regulator n=1 Tax=Amycolatopsis acidiphila TaxID=715473 RepID=A0A558AJN1_9PSEU|nr:MarR family transcriptional regulator [Amycolatopsis acidiphila]TVT24474.1 MarR family transcriptional regulator [Amycolatopsis acidiphila]UIJ59315.1 MarR family transcriptional regulator [Amycolatopsis acidiphila]GHG79661.1 MarR family transcriptional regulator [Amycolatopsis acidiphila]